MNLLCVYFIVNVVRYNMLYMNVFFVCVYFVCDLLGCRDLSAMQAITSQELYVVIGEVSLCA